MLTLFIWSDYTYCLVFFILFSQPNKQTNKQSSSSSTCWCCCPELPSCFVVYESKHVNVHSVTGFNLLGFKMKYHQYHCGTLWWSDRGCTRQLPGVNVCKCDRSCKKTITSVKLPRTVKIKTKLFVSDLTKTVWRILLPVAPDLRQLLM